MLLAASESVSLTGYHGSPAPFDVFDFDRPASSESHANGCLGCRMARDRALAANFGDALLTATIIVAPAEILALPIKTLSATAQQDEGYHAAWRKRLVATAYKIALLVESCGRSDMMIVLDNSCVTDSVWD